jgi:hypothetical protein
MTNLPLKLARAIHVGRVDWPQIRDAADRIVKADDKAKRRPKRSPRSVSFKPTKAEQTAKDRARQRKVYAAVDLRSGGCCEEWYCLRVATEHDHFWGRGKAEETVENVWHLCKEHHEEKTANDPSRAGWIATFRRHCFAQDYREEMAKCDRALALEAAQHPGAETRESGRTA